MGELMAPRGRVLVVDDDLGVLDVLSEMVATPHYVVDRTETATAALAAMATFRPDVVLLDLAMPGLSGLEALPSFRRLHPEVPVIVVTAVVDPATVQHAREQGALDILGKPFHLPVLERMLADAMKKRAGD
jgi:DNA-binding NtrC family response regulator